MAARSNTDSIIETAKRTAAALGLQDPEKLLSFLTPTSIKNQKDMESEAVADMINEPAKAADWPEELISEIFRIHILQMLGGRGDKDAVLYKKVVNTAIDIILVRLAVFGFSNTKGFTSTNLKDTKGSIRAYTYMEIIPTGLKPSHFIRVYSARLSTILLKAEFKAKVMLGGFYKSYSKLFKSPESYWYAFAYGIEFCLTKDVFNADQKVECLCVHAVVAQALKRNDNSEKSTGSIRWKKLNNFSGQISVNMEAARKWITEHVVMKEVGVGGFDELEKAILERFQALAK